MKKLRKGHHHQLWQLTTFTHFSPAAVWMKSQIDTDVGQLGHLNSSLTDELKMKKESHDNNSQSLAHHSFLAAAVKRRLD